MAIKDKTKIFPIGGSKAVTIPASVFADSTFPFKDEKTELIAEIVDKKLIIREPHKSEL